MSFVSTSFVSPELAKVKRWLRGRRRRTDVRRHELVLSVTEIKGRFRSFIRQSRGSWPSCLSRPASPVPTNSTSSFALDPSYHRQTVDPPPPYSPPTADFPLELSSCSVSVPEPLPPPDICEESSPPTYRPQFRPCHRHASPRANDIPRSEEEQRLEAVFVLHPWSSSWGPRPTSLNSALKEAALRGNQRLVLTLLDAGAEIKANESIAIQEDTPVHAALQGPNLHLALELLRHSSVSTQTRRGLLDSRGIADLTPLHLAAQAGKAVITRELVKLGAVVDRADRIGRTALHVAARHGRRETVDVLLDEGADIAKINPQLWLRARDDCEKALLGQFNLIHRFLQDALLDKEGRRGHSAKEAEVATTPAEQVDAPDQTLNVPFAPTSENRAATRRPRPVSYQSTLSYDSASRHTTRPSIPTEIPRRYPGSLHRHSQSADQGLAAHSRLASVYGSREVDAARRVLAHRNTPTRNTRKPPQSLLHTPEYARWKRNCETLQAESRAQREKNKRENRVSWGA
ncbi:hypothetical protein B0H66DRAFT_182133 [Apodospora peruviana]|uniref:Ankyrin n=1 Tax=Apodospora peruviana TaxID=516989 RepID=A0AAE0IB44_9PEZI|nr:hypothetical protein B0H66DRAFT_182133 [Apodospora peruviana]